MAFAKEAAAKKSIEDRKSQSEPGNHHCWRRRVAVSGSPGKDERQVVFRCQEGRQEILYRRIGANELDAITVCRGYVEAQKEYALEIHDDSGVNQYAQKIFSTPGKQDGLYWKNADGLPPDQLATKSPRRWKKATRPAKGGFHGYYFKILKGQGPAAPNGAINYVIEGVMIGGFALVAVPAEYRVTGVKTFIVNNDGIVYQKDLGPDSLNIVKEMELYNPDKTWQPTDDEWPQECGSSNAVTARAG